MDVCGEEEVDSDCDSSLESNSHRASDQLENLHEQLLSLGLPDDFGALVDEIKDHHGDNSDDSSCDAQRHHKRLTISDAPQDVIETVIYHCGRRNRPCSCLSNYTTSHGGTYSMDLLVQLIIESRDFVRVEDRGITDCVRNLIRRKCTPNHRLQARTNQHEQELLLSHLHRMQKKERVYRENLSQCVRWHSVLLIASVGMHWRCFVKT